MDHETTILVTGASGFLGRRLTARLEDTGNVVSVGHSDDVANAIAHLLDIGGRGIFHYSSLEGGTKYQWAQRLAELNGLTMEHIAPIREGVHSSAARPGNTHLAIHKIRRAGLRRFTPFEDVARSVLEEFQRIDS